MPLYRFYRMNKAGHIDGMPEIVDCSDDDDAVAKAKKHADGRAIEVWDLGRCVATVQARAKPETK